uniref:Uncharacterized protein n=1 Tax=Panagrellus redivivus TaxID=6233 RepID=A0A7E4ZR10_PANRE
MSEAITRHKLLKHGFDDETITVPQLVASVANYIAQNYNLEERVTEVASDTGNLSDLTQELRILLNVLDDAPESLLAEASKQSTYTAGGWFEKVLEYLVGHLDSSLLFAIENVDQSKITLDEVILPEELDDVVDAEFFGKLMELANHIAPPNKPKRLLTENLNAEEWEKVQRYVMSLSTDFRQRCSTLLNRLDVTVMSFMESSKAEGTKREELVALHEQFKDYLELPLPASVPNLLAATETLLMIDKVRGTSKSTLKSYTLDKAPPTRGGTRRLDTGLFGGARGGGSVFRRGGGAPRGGRRPRQDEPRPLSLQAQVYQEVNRQLAEAGVSAPSDGPFHRKNKRGRGQH